MDQAVLDDEEHKKREMSNEMLYASFGKRVLASLIDGLIFIPTYCLAEYNYNTWKLLPLELLLTILLPIVYKIVTEWQYGATLGKLIMKLKIVDTELNSISFIQSLKRFSIYFLSYFFSVMSTIAVFYHPEFYQVSGEEMEFLFETDIHWILLTMIFLVNFFTIIFVLGTKKRQTLHDLIAQTYCVNEKELLNLQELDELLAVEKVD
jgi:uncharacterized RDD family membrane protein YckC